MNDAVALMLLASVLLFSNGKTNCHVVGKNQGNCKECIFMFKQRMRPSYQDITVVVLKQQKL